jgi:hypothetical protein
MNEDLSQLVLSFCNDFRVVLRSGAVNRSWLRHSNEKRKQIMRSFEMIRWMKRMQLAGYYGQSLTCYAHFTVYQAPAWPGVQFAWCVEVERRDGTWLGFVMIDPLNGAVFVPSRRSEQEGPSVADIRVFRDARDFVWHLDQLQRQITVHYLPQ